MKDATWSDVLVSPNHKYTLDYPQIDLGWRNGSQEEKAFEQRWFWSEEWQEGEREADEDIAKGRMKNFDSFEDLKRDLLE
jgi:hypothetical protein